MSEPAIVMRRCARGPRCYAAERVTTDRTTDILGAPCDRPLCEVCEGAARHVLEETPKLYVQLRLKMRDQDVAERGPQVTVSKDQPLPVNGRALHLAEQVAWLVTTWEDEVRLIARLSDVERAGCREGRQVADATLTLSRWLSVWISAPSTAINLSMTDGEIEQSGVEAIGALLDWRAAVRRLPGMDTRAPRAVHRYPTPCATCGVAAITHHAGDTLMVCQSCGGTAPYGVFEEMSA